MGSKKYRLSRDLFGVHQKIIKLVPPNSTVLDIGCASGFMANELNKKNCRVYGIELDPTASTVARNFCVQVVTGDIGDLSILSKLKVAKFDIILLTDVIEHLKDPLSVLKLIKQYVSSAGQILISIPNVAFLTVRLNLLRGKFNYTEFGIMDRTHVKFYTKNSLQKLLKSAHLTIVEWDYVGNFTQLPLFMQTLYPLIQNYAWWRNLEYEITKIWPETLAVQFIVSCK